MNSAEAKEMTEFGMWAKIRSEIKERITDACNDGEFTISIPERLLSDEDSYRLSELGYYIESHEEPLTELVYIISWR